MRSGGLLTYRDWWTPNTTGNPVEAASRTGKTGFARNPVETVGGRLLTFGCKNLVGRLDQQSVRTEPNGDENAGAVGQIGFIEFVVAPLALAMAPAPSKRSGGHGSVVRGSGTKPTTSLARSKGGKERWKTHSCQRYWDAGPSFDVWTNLFVCFSWTTN